MSDEPKGKGDGPPENSGDGAGGNTTPHKGSGNLRPPWKKGQSGNPAGRPKQDGLQKLCRRVLKQELRKLAPAKAKVLFGDAGEEVPFDSSEPPTQLHPIVHAALIREAARYSGLMTEHQRVSLLFVAVKARSEFASLDEWLDFVAAVAGHRRRELSTRDEEGD